MKWPSGRSIAVLALVMLAVPLAAQRGGRSGGGRPETKSVYDSNEYGMKFPVPPGLELYTPQDPGPYISVLSDRRIIYLVGVSSRDVSVSARYSPNVPEAELKAFKDTLDSSPPQAKLPGYKKISARVIMIGARADKEAVEHVYDVTNNNVRTTVRQVMFVHKGNGFTFTCSAVERQYASIDKRSFEPIFAAMEFR
jgi:hypothetical protein